MPTKGASCSECRLRSCGRDGGRCDRWPRGCSWKGGKLELGGVESPDDLVVAAVGIDGIAVGIKMDVITGGALECPKIAGEEQNHATGDCERQMRWEQLHM